MTYSSSPKNKVALIKRTILLAATKNPHLLERPPRVPARALQIPQAHVQPGQDLVVVSQARNQPFLGADLDELLPELDGVAQLPGLDGGQDPVAHRDGARAARVGRGHGRRVGAAQRAGALEAPAVQEGRLAVLVGHAEFCVCGGGGVKMVS
ncbi:hypothetical protein PspLS_05898 [Pyricularia sp. CBS 133598]|nr:hypothetical protein PspLS_05898 [Pyricularia sp. CBS 133598]